MGYYHPVGGKGTQAELAKSYGVKGVNYGTKNNLGGKQIRTINDVERGISAAMANDYSTREFLKYNDDIREEMKRGLPNSRKENNALFDAMKQAHRDNGNGGKYDNAFDRAGVAQNSFEDYMKNLKGNMKGPKKPEPEQTPNTPRDQYPISEEQARVNQREQDTFSGRDTAETFDPSYRADTPGQNFLDRYRMNFMPSKKGKNPAMVNRGLA